MIKHVGKMKNNGAKVAVVYRTLPGDSGQCLVVGTGSLPDTWHDSLMNLIQDASGQSANELADIIAVRKFPDGHTMLEALHTSGLLKKVPTNGVIMTPTPQSQILLSELNVLIAEEKGVTIDELAITDGINPNPKTKKNVNETLDKVAEPKFEVPNDAGKTTSASVNETTDDNLSPAQMRSKADALFKQAQSLRKQADAIDPPKSKKKEIVGEDAS